MNLKVLLSQRLAPVGSEKFTKVLLVAMLEGKVTRIELPNNYFLDMADVARLKVVNGVIDIEVS